MLADALCAARPDCAWTVHLLDLPHHGRSPGAPAVPADMRSCGAKVAEWCVDHAPHALIGHSLGGTHQCCWYLILYITESGRRPSAVAS